MITKRGFGFGVTSATITTLGVLVGLYSSTESKLIVLAGILSVMIADAFSDSFGIHVAEESFPKKKQKAVWKETFSTFVTKLIFAGIFLIPLLILELKQAIITDLFLGGIILSIYSYNIAKKRKDNPLRTICEHLGIGVIVVVITYFVGKLFV